MVLKIDKKRPGSVGHDPKLKYDIEAAARVALAAAGGQVEHVDKAKLVNQFIKSGVSRATLYRWVNVALGQPVVISQTGLPDLPRIPPAALRPVVRVGATQANIGGLADVMGGSAVAVVEKLMACVKAAEDVMAHSRREDGSVRVAKNLISASEHLRRTLETAARLHESMVSLQKLDRYMDAMFAELEAESPDLAARVLARLQAVDAAWREGATNAV